MEEGAVKRGMDRYDELTCEGEKPLTTLVVLRSEAALAESEDKDGTEGVATDSGVDCASAMTVGSAAFSSSGTEIVMVVGMLRVMGSRSLFSLMMMTIFSRSSGVMCLSRPRLLLVTESCRRTAGRAISRGPEVEEAVVLSLSNSSASSFARESTLLERLGTSYWPSGLLDAVEMAGVVELASETGSQQKVSLVQSLQLRFSSLRPSSSDFEHREKTVPLLASAPIAVEMAGRLTCPHAEEILYIFGVDFVDETDVHGQDWCCEGRHLVVFGLLDRTS